MSGRQPEDEMSPREEGESSDPSLPEKSSAADRPAQGEDLAAMFDDGEEWSAEAIPPKRGDVHATADRDRTPVDERKKKTYKLEAKDPDGPPSVLVVDDSSMARLMVCQVVEDLGYHAVEAADGLEAIAQARYHEPSLIILDILMPGLSGLDTLRELRADPKFESTPIIMLTVESKRNAIQSAISQQVSDYLIKPVDMKEMAKRIKKYMPPLEQPPETADS